MKKILFVFLLFCSFQSFSQSVSGYWYGNANVKTNSSANNYLVELIVNQNKTLVTGVMNYYFKDKFRSFKVSGNYNSMNRQLYLYNIPVIYYGSLADFEIDCIMNFQATLRAAKAGSNLIGNFVADADHKYTCKDIAFNLKLDADASNQDSVLNAIRLYKETYQVWKPQLGDTLVAATIIQRKVVNYVIEKEFTERQNDLADEIEVNSDSLKVDFYDNGEVDGDSISVFFNKKLLAYHQRLSTRSIHFDLVLDSSQQVNELTMFADNLGSIPPNTALMIVYDGKKRYEIRMSSNLQRNATVRIKRKK